MRKMFFAALMAASLTMSVAAQADEYAVVDAKLTLDHRAGSILTPDSEIKLLPGSMIVVMSAAGEMIEIKGPAKGKLSGILSGKATGGDDDPALIGAVAALFKSDGKSRNSLAAFRSLGQPNAGKLNYKTSNPWYVSTIESGTYCIRKDMASDVLWNPRRNDKIGTLSMAGSKVQLTWPADGDALDWPGDLSLTDGAKYAFKIANAEPVEMTLHVIDGGDFNATLKQMADKGCIAQGRKLLKAQARGELK